jgi:hypothetical protein
LINHSIAEIPGRKSATGKIPQLSNLQAIFSVLATLFFASRLKAAPQACPVKFGDHFNGVKYFSICLWPELHYQRIAISTRED